MKNVKLGPIFLLGGIEFFGVCSIWNVKKLLYQHITFP